MIKLEQAISLIDRFEYNYLITTVTITSALNKTLASDIYAPIDVPHFNKSAMDGYAIRKIDLETNNFTIVATTFAGDNHNINLQANQAQRIMTGAKIANNADFVIQQELAVIKDNQLSFNIPNQLLNPNICYIGEDILHNQLLFPAGTCLNPTKIAALISAGITTVEIYQQPRILVLSTGNEITTSASLEQIQESTQIYNSNQAFIAMRLQQCYLNSITLKHINDDLDQLVHFLTNHIDDFDLIVTTGAISVGQKDIIRQMATKNPQNIIFDRINIMPGGPCMFWQYLNTPIISLAGSPFANLVTFELIVITYLSNLLHNPKLRPILVDATFQDYYVKKIKKTRFLKVNTTNNQVTLANKTQYASSIYDMANCNSFLYLKAGNINLKPNDPVKIIKLGGTYE